MGVLIVSVESIATSVADVLNKHRGNVEDIFFDYKDDEDLRIDCYMFDLECANNLVKDMKIYDFYYTTHVHDPDWHSPVVRMDFPTLALRDAVVTTLRAAGYTVNGG